MNRNHVAALAAGLWLAAAGVGQQPAGGAFLVGPGTRGAMLNGQPLLPGTAILPGETVSTESGGIAVLTPTGAGGGAVELVGGASATVAAAGAGEAPLQLQQGDALIYGPVAVHTPQGETLLPQTGSTSFVVNVGPAQSSLGVLTGAVATRQAATTVTVPQGQARSWSAAGQMRTVPLAQLHQPQPDSSMPKLTPASVSR